MVYNYNKNIRIRRKTRKYRLKITPQHTYRISNTCAPCIAFWTLISDIHMRLSCKWWRIYNARFTIFFLGFSKIPFYVLVGRFMFLIFDRTPPWNSSKFMFSNKNSLNYAHSKQMWKVPTYFYAKIHLIL